MHINYGNILLPYFQALYQKAESLYQLGRYEHALVFYHRGHRLRPELDQFRIGINKSQDAILGLGLKYSVMVSLRCSKPVTFHNQH